MIFIGNFDKINAEKYKVGTIHYMPFDKIDGMGETEEQMLTHGALLESLAEPEDNGKTSELFFNPLTKTTYYEYVDTPKTEAQIQAEKIANLMAENVQLKADQKATSDALAEFILGGTV
ncbi:hypothetical protein [Acetobacterium tundrae]|uniref:Uncharacterized protein n=1 Tax=Acetobacterium tundrae TaxID=132932 RepID=A0ABR6WPG7_9FIRM|nr:hypothetical protein [Acetobacterium tundrae]MBC3798012.1 hypothetical protein [Acetobacterium tundrae]